MVNLSIRLETGKVKPQGTPMDMQAEERWRKQRPSCNGKDTDWNIIRLERVQTFNRCLIVRKFEEPLKGEKQMTESFKITGATPCLGNHWKSIDWNPVKAEVKRLQMRIAKAVREKKGNKVKTLQWILSHSYSAKLLGRASSNTCPIQQFNCRAPLKRSFIGAWAVCRETGLHGS